MHALPSSQLAQAAQATAPAPDVVPSGQAVQLTAPPVAKVPSAHAEQLAAPAPLVNEPGGHAVQIAFAVAVHAVAWKVPASQALHALHTPPSRKNAVGQLPHSFALGPEQAVQLASHALHAVFVVAVHAADG